MNLKWPYKLLLILLLVTGGAYAASPYFAMQSIADAVKDNSSEKLQEQVRVEDFKIYTRTLLEGLLRYKLKLEMKNPNIDTGTAMQDFTFAMKARDRLADKMTEAKGFTHLLCGEVARFPGFPAKHDSDCWAVDGELNWQSLAQVMISFKNPENGWVTQVQLERVGLFNWQAVAIDMPVDEMLTLFE